MKRTLLTLLASGIGCSALAQQAPIPDWLKALPRSDYGCEVLLCLANPEGPKATPRCVPPIDRLMRDLARGRGFPTCNMASGPSGRSYASLTGRPYDACPQGATELPARQYAELAAPIPAPPPMPSGSASNYGAGRMGLTYAGIGDGRQYYYLLAEGRAAPVKVCVAGYRGSRRYWNEDRSYTVGVYDRIYAQNAMRGLAIDVFIDDSLWQTVRW